VLLRPDGHVAWVGDDQQDLLGQLPTWFGAPVDWARGRGRMEGRGKSSAPRRPRRHPLGGRLLHQPTRDLCPAGGAGGW